MTSPRHFSCVVTLAALAGAAGCSDDGRATASDPTTNVPATPGSIGSDPGTVGGTTEPGATETDGPTTGADPTGNASNSNSMSMSMADDTGLKFDIGGAGTDTDTDSGGNCVGLECQIPECMPGQKTTLKGTVFAPEGTLPLYNAIVYIPNAPLNPVPEGVTCDNCMMGLSGDPIVATLTDTRGEFVLEDVPAGADIPLVLLIGKWRRELKVQVQPCVENLVDPAQSRLPRNQSEGHIPKIALTTGGADPLECLIRKLGMDDAEFTPEGGSGRVNLYEGRDGTGQYAGNLNGGADFSGAAQLWNDPLRLQTYDMVLFACEGTTDGGNKSNEARQNIVDFAGAGGRLFFTHWHNIWIEEGVGGWQSAAEFDHQDDLDSPFTANINTGFPKGAAMAEWLVNVDASDQLGEIEIVAGQNTIASVNEDISTRWIYGENPTSVQYFTFNTPIDVAPENQCGRVVDTDIHVSNGDQVGDDFPNGCQTQELSPQEKALIFMFFELSSCIIPDDEDPVIPG